MTLLIVEDDPTLREVLVESFVELGFSVRCAATAREALRILATDDAVRAMLSDVSMPGMSGVELVVAARHVAPALRTILMTGDVGVEPPADLAPVVELVVAKPFDVTSVADRLSRLCGRS